MKRSGIYLPKEVYECWEAYARARGGHMSRNNVLEELTFYLLFPEKLEAREEAIRLAIEEAKPEIRRLLEKKVSDGEW